MNNIGRRLYGYCGGAFGRDHCWDVMVVGEGEDWIVVRGMKDHDYLNLNSFKNVAEKLAFLAENELRHGNEPDPRDSED